jgi:hypothetical protein
LDPFRFTRKFRPKRFHKIDSSIDSYNNNNNNNNNDSIAVVAKTSHPFEPEKVCAQESNPWSEPNLPTRA